ncbi:hypothetical protein ACH5RR_035666 [Cinchona calisaya]|uniref:RING-type E3 ubiquitin transferase n=1 Tax=Cinchona calisaya TaxID=153742 RepID=A0ABD2Y457_9GENT
MPWIQSGSTLRPAILFIIVILAVVFFISGLLHLLVRFLMRRRSSQNSQSNTYPDMSDSEAAYQRQLQQLFNLHDSGLDQAFIDALPVFLYKDIIMGSKEPFDCAVCLCEFFVQDKLRLLPLCGHAFHIDCIDKWLLSNSTCPLCRGTLFSPDEFSIENPIFEFDDLRDDEDWGFSGNVGVAAFPCGPKPTEAENVVNEKRVFSVRLGKFRNTNTNDSGKGEEDIEVGETSNSNLDARRCFSMGSFQYVVADSELHVTLCPKGTRANGLDLRLLKAKERGGNNGNSLINDGDSDGKKINIRSKGESFSVSKVWLWSNKGKFPSSTGNQISSSSINVSLPWTDRTH